MSMLKVWSMFKSLVVIVIFIQLVQLLLPPHRPHQVLRMDTSFYSSIEEQNLTHTATDKISLAHVMEMVSDSNDTKHLWPWSNSSALAKCPQPNKLRFSPLLKTSIIITFINNENLSTLLHTVHSIVQRTPASLLHEIILVADNVYKDDLGEILDIYVKAVFHNVHVHHSDSRLGLIKARLVGIHMATGEVVVCMDSHMEVQPGWLEPMLQEIDKNPRTLAVSFLDWMEKNDKGLYLYRHAGLNWMTYFDWKLYFAWLTVAQTPVSPTEVIDSPTMVGGIFGIKKSWFTHVGEYDDGMLFWGGENIDLTVRVWLFGGRVVMVPCSRVAHLEFAHNRDYRTNFTATIQRNYKRFALVWMDDYIKYFNLYLPDVSDDVGDLSQRLALKKRCPHDFKWFLKNVYPELGAPEQDGLAYGRLMNLERKLCVVGAASFKALTLGRCDQPASNTYFFWSRELHLRFPIFIFNALNTTKDGENIVKVSGHGYMSFYGKPEKGSQWVHRKGGHFIETSLQLCLEAISPETVELKKCDGKKNAQRWEFAKYTGAYDSAMNGTQTDLIHIAKKIAHWQTYLLNTTGYV